MALLLEVEEEEIEKELGRETQSLLDRHHQFPALYAVYYFYKNGLLHVDKNGKHTLTMSGLLMAC